MHLTHSRVFEQGLPTESGSVRRNDFDRGYEDEETFERPRHGSRQERRRQHARLLACCRAHALDEDDLDEVAADFGNR